MVNVFSNSDSQFFDTAEDAAAQPILCQVAEEAFYRIQPGAAGGREVHVETRMALWAMKTKDLWRREWDSFSRRSFRFYKL